MLTDFSVWNRETLNQFAKEACRKMIEQDAEIRRLKAIVSGVLPMSASKAEPVYAILEERDFQDRKHGPISGKGGHTLGEWVILAEDELAEARRALIKGGTGRDSFRSEVIQAAAVLFACLEQHGTADPHDGRQI